MIDPLLSTKISIPLIRAEIVERTHLLDRLNGGLNQEDGFAYQLTLVSAPPGYGKTTFISAWIKRLGLPCAWLSLDETDNDPIRFLTYLIAAVRRVRDGFGETASKLLVSNQGPPIEVVLTILVNELAAISTPLVFVLDDYHVIHSLPIHKQLTFLLEHQPVNLHLVVATREDPLLPVARLRVRNKIMEIRQDDLRFTIDETTDFLTRVMGLELNSEQVIALEHHTEGWIAGLQLAALSMRGHDDAAVFIQEFTGSSRFVLDYLVEEVFERQPPAVKDFLLRTSILERLCIPLCDAVLEGQSSSDSREILDYLEHSNLFVTPLDQSRTWYRYHRLFQELLSHRLRLSGLNEAEFRIRASQWYEENGLTAEAVQHALSARDWARAARLIGMINETMLKKGESVTLLNWCESLPVDLVHSNMQLCMVQAWAALMTSRFDVAAPLLEHAEQLAEPGSNFMGEVASAQAYLARSLRDNAKTIEKSEQALKFLSRENVANRGIIAMNLGLAYWHEGQLFEAESALLQACDLCSKAGNQFALLTAQLFLVKVAGSRGKLHQAAELAEKLIQVGGQAPILLLAHGDLAEIYQEWNDLQKAKEHSEQVFALSQRSGNLEFIQAAYLRRAVVAHAMGNDEEAISALAEADRMSRDFPAVIRSRVAAFGVQMALTLTDSKMLADWEPLVSADVDFHSFYRFMGVTRPRLLIARGKKAEAAEVLKGIYETASRFEWAYGMIFVRILQSLAARDLEDAVIFISDALRIGKKERFVRSFIDAGMGIIPILQEAAKRGVEAAYANEILAGMGEKVRSMGAGVGSMIEALSEREVEVLRLVTAGMSNREIAAKLFISAGTAKTHIHHLCGKLGVRNRTEAAMRAKELGLV